MSVLSEKAYLSVCLLLAEVKWQWKFYVGQTKTQTSGDGKTSWQTSRFPPAGLSVSMQTSNASTHLEKKPTNFYVNKNPIQIAGIQNNKYHNISSSLRLMTKVFLKSC